MCKYWHKILNNYVDIKVISKKPGIKDDDSFYTGDTEIDVENL